MNKNRSQSHNQGNPPRRGRGRPSRMGNPTVEVTSNGKHDQLTKKSDSQVGYDVFYTGPDIELHPGQFSTFETGMSFHTLPPKTHAIICPRFDLAQKGLIALNNYQVIDNDFCGHIKIVLMNATGTVHKINHGSEIAQITFQPTSTVNVLFHIRSSPELPQ